MDRIQPNELVSLIFGVVCAVIIISILLRERLPRLGLFFLGFAFLLAANFFTVVEGLLWGALFNTLEHLSYLLAGISFAAAAWKIRRTPEPSEEAHGSRRVP